MFSRVDLHFLENPSKTDSFLRVRFPCHQQERRLMPSSVMYLSFVAQA
jgi:hypothetical protein